MSDKRKEKSQEKPGQKERSKRSDESAERSRAGGTSRSGTRKMDR